jgi:hypothetical protein
MAALLSTRKLTVFFAPSLQWMPSHRQGSLASATRSSGRQPGQGLATSDSGQALTKTGARQLVFSNPPWPLRHLAGQVGLQRFFCDMMLGHELLR